MFPDKAAVKTAERIQMALVFASPAALRRARPRDRDAWAAASFRLATLRDERTVTMERPLVATATAVWRARVAIAPELREHERALRVVHAALLVLSLDGTERQDASARETLLHPAARLVKAVEAEQAAARPPAAAE